jgi:hypothetical protein
MPAVAELAVVHPTGARNIKDEIDIAARWRTALRS